MPDYPDLYKLRISETPYTAERIIDDVLQSSPECQLPTDIPLTLNLTPLTVELPPLECKFDNLVPLIPLPDFCHPHVSGTISASSCNTGVITANSSVTLTQINDCDFELGGAIEICPDPGICTDFSTSASLPVTVTGNGITGDGTLFLYYGACSFEIDGAINIDSTIKCVEALTFGGTADASGGGLSGSITLDPNGDCGATLSGSISSSVVCHEPLVFDGSIPITGAGISGTIDLINSGDCGATLEGSIDLTVVCTEAVTGTGEVNFVIEAPLEGSGTLYLTDNAECGITLNGEVNIGITDATFQALTVCIDGETFTKYVLMRDYA